MSDRRLIVGEFDPTDANNGKLFALSPGDATGVALPSFQVGAARPRIGTTKGEGYFDTNQRQGFVWTGSAWDNIAPNPIMTFTTEALLLADTTPRPGVYATAGDTGSLFIKTPGGWRQVGIKPYATAIDLLGDAGAAVGSLGEAMDEDSLWEKTAAGWRLMLIREMATTAAIVAWKNTDPGATIGDRAVDKATGVTYIRVTAGWRPITIWEDTEANIRAATWALNGQEAIATDTGRTFARAAGHWIEEPIAHYATEAALLAATLAPGTLAWADDTNVVFTRVAGTPAGAGGTPAAKPDTWKRLAAPQITVGTTAPTTPGKGDFFFDTDKDELKVWSGTAWAYASTPHWEATVTMGANAGTVGNQIILAKGITPTNDGIYVSIADTQTGHNGGRSAYAIHAFSTDSTGSAKATPIHISTDGTRFNKLHWFWKDSTDGYVLSATISEACVGAVYRIGMMSPTAELHTITGDGNTLVTDTSSGTVIDVTSSAGVGGLSNDAFDNAVKAAVARVFPTVATPTLNGTAGTPSTSFNWVLFKPGTIHRWIVDVDRSAKWMPVLYMESSAAANKTVKHDGLLFVGTDQFALDRSDTQSGPSHGFALGFGDANNSVNNGNIATVSLEFYEITARHHIIVKYRMQYRRKSDDRQSICEALMYIGGQDTQPMTGKYALNSFTDDTPYEIRQY